MTSQTHDGPARYGPAADGPAGEPAPGRTAPSEPAPVRRAPGALTPRRRASGGPTPGRTALDGLAANTAGPARYAPLRGQPVHKWAGEWVVTRPDDVDAVLASDAMTVAPAGEPAGAAGRLQARMARFSDGAAHERRRRLAEVLIPATADAERAAWTMTAETITGWRGRPDAMDLARQVPVAVLASALGVPSAGVDPVVGLTGQLCDALAPRTGAGLPGATAPATDGDAAATALLAALAAVVAPARAALAVAATTSDPATPPDRTRSSAHAASSAPAARPTQPARAVAAASILFQARDATAGLIGLALAAAAGHPQAAAADLVELVLRADPPVQFTRRTATAPTTIGEVTIPAGAAVRVLLATADRGRPWTPATFGSGPHGCPGRLLATALARGVVGAVLGAGWRPVPDPAPGYELRPNLRIPVSVPIEQPCQLTTVPTEQQCQLSNRAN